MPMHITDFADKTVLVMGLGRFGGGLDAARFAAMSGAKVIITDLAKENQLSEALAKLTDFPHIEYHLGSHQQSDFEKADIVIVNPAVPPDNKFLKTARKAGALVTSQVNIFFEHCPGPIIGITGANGKSTTTALTAHLLENAYKNKKVLLTGNIGNQPLLTILNEIAASDIVVMELSSFQIEQLAENHKAPQIALLTNLTPNHLDRYDTFENYCAAKENIFKYQQLNPQNQAVSIFNAEDKIALQWYEKYKADAGRVCIKFSADDVTDELRRLYQLPGRANLSNLAAALAITSCYSIDQKSIEKSLSAFKALSHRLELISDKNGIRWYNDSKATTPEGTLTALAAFEQPIILIAGGYDKNLPFDKLSDKIAEKAKAVILIGQTAPKIAEAIKGHKSRRAEEQKAKDEERGPKIEIVNSLADAVQLANAHAKSSDIVLLSPACASYDMFENYEQRGRLFTNYVRAL